MTVTQEGIVVGSVDIDTQQGIEVGNVDEEAQQALLANALQRGNTAQVVGTVMKNRNRALFAGGIQGLLGVVIVALDVIGVTSKADNEHCDSSPLEWGSFYLVHAIIIGVGIFMTFIMLYAQSLILNKHMVASQVHERKGSMAEAARDKEKGSQQAAQGTTLLLSVCCCGLYPHFIVAIVWFIMGIVTYVNSDGKACDEAKNWYWVIFATSLVMQCISMCIKAMMQQQQL